MKLRLLIDDYQVEIIMTAEAVVSDREQAVSIRRQVNATTAWLLAHEIVDKSRSLMAETIVVVSPAGGCEQVIQRGTGLAPRNVQTVLEPLRMLHCHRIHHHREGFIGRE